MAALGCNVAAMAGAPAVGVAVSEKARLGSSVPTSQGLGLSKFLGLRSVRSDVAGDVAVRVRNLKAKHLVSCGVSVCGDVGEDGPRLVGEVGEYNSVLGYRCGGEGEFWTPGLAHGLCAHGAHSV